MDNDWTVKARDGDTKSRECRTEIDYNEIFHFEQDTVLSEYLPEQCQQFHEKFNEEANQLDLQRESERYWNEMMKLGAEQLNAQLDEQREMNKDMQRVD